MRQATLQRSRSRQGPSSLMTTMVADDLRHRDYLSAQVVRDLEDKIARMTQARADRITALHKIRSALAKAILAGNAAPERRANIR